MRSSRSCGNSSLQGTGVGASQRDAGGGVPSAEAGRQPCVTPGEAACVTPGEAASVNPDGAVKAVGAPAGVGLQLSVANANNSANSGDGVAHVEPGGLSATQEAASISHGSGAPVAKTALHHLEQALHHLERAASGSGDLHHLEQALRHLEQAASDRKVSSDDARADCGTPMTSAALEMRAARAI